MRLPFARPRIVRPGVVGAGEPDPARTRDAELERLRSAPVRQRTETTLFEPPLLLMDGPSFVPQYHDIFLLEIYDFPHDGETPVIIDGGANIGLGVLWWRAKWPRARVIALEPDPTVFGVLSENLRHHQGLELHQAALSTPALGHVFSAEGTDAGRLEPSQTGEFPTTAVPTMQLADLLDSVGHVDLLKLDIEGAETEVLLSVADRLDQIDRIFFEYHSFARARQTLADLLFLMREAGFRVAISTPPTPLRPFRGAAVDRGIDGQCNVWAWRESETVNEPSKAWKS